MKKAQTEQHARRRTRVLIVEDEASALEASRRYLDFVGFVVATAASAREAELTAREFAPDVVVCDWRLAGARDGIDVARSLRASHGARVIFVTANPLDELKEQTADLDVLRYFRKPISLSWLAETIGAVEPT